MAESRYLPFTQQPYCCVPTCVQVILYKNGLQLMTQEEIGRSLGLVVATSDKHLFENVESSDRPVVASGFGTRIQDKRHSMPSFLKKYRLPFDFSYIAASSITSPEDLLHRLEDYGKANDDVMACFMVGPVYENEQRYGHVCVFDRIENGNIMLVDPSPNHPKELVVVPARLYEAIERHGDDNYGGLWELKRQV